jgi:hypothetical protein
MKKWATIPAALVVTWLVVDTGRELAGNEIKQESRCTAAAADQKDVMQFDEPNQAAPRAGWGHFV